MTRKEKKQKRICPIKNNQGVLVFDDTEKAEAMNLYFSSIGGKLARDLPQIQFNKNENVNAQTTENNKISSVDYDEKLFEKALLKIKPGKAHGQDDISAKELNVIGSEFSYSLSMIANLSFQATKYPTTWKIGKVKTAHKKEDKTESENYRPLTMLSIPSKTVESVTCISFDKHLEDSIHKNQWAYKKGLSTESLLLYLSEQWK